MFPVAKYVMYFAHCKSGENQGLGLGVSVSVRASGHSGISSDRSIAPMY